MPKGNILKIQNQDACNGCELCVHEVQAQLKKVGLEGALIRVLKSRSDRTAKLTFLIEKDPRVDKLDIEAIKNICPKNVFSIAEEEEHEFNV